MKKSSLRRMLREGGWSGTLLIGVFLLMRAVWIHRNKIVLRFSITMLAGVALCRSLVVLCAMLYPLHSQTTLREDKHLYSVTEHGQFYLDYRLPTSQQGNSVAVAGFWKERGENLPHSSALWTLDPFSGQVHRLSYGSLVDYQTDWQPGGKRLAFTGNSFTYAGADTALPLYICDVATGHRTEVVAPVVNKWYISHLAWSPDGKWLAYNRDLWPYKQADSQELGTWIVSADGKQQFRLPVPRGVERFEFVEWRPGKSDVYVSEGYPYNNRSLWLCNLKGNACKIAAPSTYPAFVHAPRRGEYFCVRTIEKEGPYTSHHVRTFTAEGTAELDLGLIDQTGDAKWSINGKWLAFAKREPTAGKVTLHMLCGDGTRRQEVIAGYGRVYQPTRIVWSSNNRHMLVVSEEAYIVDAEQGKSRKFESSFWPCSFRADGRIIGLSYSQVGILSQSGKVEKVYPPETFSDVE